MQKSTESRALSSCRNNKQRSPHQETSHVGIKRTSAIMLTICTTDTFYTAVNPFKKLLEKTKVKGILISSDSCTKER